MTMKQENWIGLIVSVVATLLFSVGTWRLTNFPVCCILCGVATCFCLSFVLNYADAIDKLIKREKRHFNEKL